MKKTLITIIAVLLTTALWAQETFTNYKAVVANDAGIVLANQSLDVRFTIYEGNPDDGGGEIFQEIHNTTTDANGIIVLNIGAINLFDWTEIVWEFGPHYLKTEYNIGDGFVDMGTQAFRYVPYAQFALTASYIDFNNIDNVPAGLSDGDDDTQLTETQVDNYVSNNGYLTTEVDGSNTNELQTISKIGSTVTLSNGGGSFTDTDTDTHLTETQVDNYVSNNGYLTTEVDGSTTNELQTISKIGSTVTLSNGGGNFTDDNTTYSAGTGITITGTTIINTGDTDASDDVQSIGDLTDAKNDGSSLFIGEYAGTNNDGTDNHNVGVGRGALYNNTTGKDNTATGYYSLYANTTGDGNVTNGMYSLRSNITGNNNSATGKYSLYHNTAGSTNAAIGNHSLVTNTTGSGNTALGSGAGYSNETGNGNIFLGYHAGYNETGSNKLYIDNSSSATPLIGGDFSTDEVTINGTLETTDDVTVNGSIAIIDGTEGADKVLTSDADGNASWEEVNIPVETKQLVLHPSNFVASDNKGITYYISQTYISSTLTSAQTMYMPINLPVGVRITNIKYYYVDNSDTANLSFSFYRNGIASGSVANLGSDTTSGSNSAIQYINKDISGYLQPDYNYYIYVRNSDGAWGTTGLMNVRGIVITYEE